MVHPAANHYIKHAIPFLPTRTHDPRLSSFDPSLGRVKSCEPVFVVSFPRIHSLLSEPLIGACEFLAFAIVSSVSLKTTHSSSCPPDRTLLLGHMVWKLGVRLGIDSPPRFRRRRNRGRRVEMQPTIMPTPFSAYPQIMTSETPTGR